MHEQWREKFEALIKKSDGADACWEWQGSRLPSGYGRFYPKWKVGLYAHRVAWEMANERAIPSGLHVLHRCDNPRCVRPGHLRIGTRSDNMQDMVAKGRAGDTAHRGERHPSAKLSLVQVDEIRAEWATGGVRQRELAERYGVTRSLIGQIVRRTVWRYSA